jgi:hypothetical protein
MSSRRLASSAESGSSSSSTSGSMTIGAGQRDALLLAAGQLLRIAVAEIGQLHQFQRVAHRRSLLLGTTSRYLRPKATFSATVLCGNSA